MPLYRLEKGSHSTVKDGKRIVYTAGDSKHNTLELTAEQANLPHLRKRLTLIGGGGGTTTTTATAASSPLDFKPDDDSETDTSVLDQNVSDVVSYLDTIADDEEALTALREAEVQGKNRVTVLNAIDELLGN